MSRSIALRLAAVAMGAAGLCLWARDTGAPLTPPIDREAEARRARLPRTSAGDIDYVAAVGGKGAPPPEENAAIPLLAILGTDLLLGEKAAVLARLRAPTDLPASGTLVPKPAELREVFEFADMTEAEQTALSDWFRANQGPLDALFVASRRPRLWWPVVQSPTDGFLHYALSVGTLRSRIRELAERAELVRAQGRSAEGWGDIEAVLRWATLLEQQEGIILRLSATSLRTDALDWLAKGLETGATLTSLSRLTPRS